MPKRLYAKAEAQGEAREEHHADGDPVVGAHEVQRLSTSCISHYTIILYHTVPHHTIPYETIIML